MSPHTMQDLVKVSLTPALLALLAVIPCGCGTSQQVAEQWQAAATTSGLEYQVDSLTNENRRLRQQLEALAIENRKITARNAELETKLSEAPAPAPVPAPRAEAPAPPKTDRAKRAPVTPPPPTGDLPSQYSDALQTYRNHDFAGAALQFEALLNSGVSEDLAGNCHYWIGQSYYDLKKYKEAIPHFETIVQMRKSTKKPDAQLMIANCYMDMGDKAAAKQGFERFLSSYPNSPYAKKARERLSHLK